MAARISRTTYPFWQTAPKIRLMTTSRVFIGGIGAHLDADADSSPCCSSQTKTFVAARGDLRAFEPVAFADIGHEDARLARDVGAKIPGIGFRKERARGHLGDVRHPGALSHRLRLQDSRAALAHVIDAVRQPVDMLFARVDH